MQSYLSPSFVHSALYSECFFYYHLIIAFRCCTLDCVCLASSFSFCLLCSDSKYSGYVHYFDWTIALLFLQLAFQLNTNLLRLKSSTANKKTRDYLYYLEVCMKDHKKLPNYHFIDVHITFMDSLLNFILFCLDFKHILKVTEILY